eukprot:12706329-Prorocentrum_lima.AAC.1
MTSSLVGSEMCIRDRNWTAGKFTSSLPTGGAPRILKPSYRWPGYFFRAVSYTHLTLPTICSV